jgi:hypothetical protein
MRIPVGQHVRLLSESFNTVPMPNLPPGWTVSTYSDTPWFTTNEPPEITNQFVRVRYGHGLLGAVSMRSPEFVIATTNAWVRLRHRYEFESGGTTARFTGTNWLGSSHGWTVSQLPLPAVAPGATQSLVFELFSLEGAGSAVWEIDSVEVFDGNAVCCGDAAPAITWIRRMNDNVVLEWTSVSNRSYQVQSKPTLNAGQAWEDFGPGILATSSRTARTNSMTSSNGFFRVRVN